MKQKIDLGFTTTGADKDERLTFAAAAVTLGFDLAEGTPKVSNCYDSKHKFEPGQPGDIRFYLPLVAHGININEFVQAWADPDRSLQDAGELPARILTADDGQKAMNLIHTFEPLYLIGTLANIRKYTLKRVSIPDVFHPSEEEKNAIRILDTFVADHIDTDAMKQKNGRKRIARLLCQYWKPAQVAWIKAYRANLLELRNLWKEVPQAIKISRPGMKMPLVLEKGPRFKELFHRWT